MDSPPSKSRASISTGSDTSTIRPSSKSRSKSAAKHTHESVSASADSSKMSDFSNILQILKQDSWRPTLRHYRRKLLRKQQTPVLIAENKTTTSSEVSLSSLDSNIEKIFDETTTVTTTAVPELEYREGEIVIRPAAVGLNPIDWKSVAYNFCLPEFPWVTGRECSGIVEKVAPGVSKFKVGDRVWTSTYYRDVRAGCFQELVVVPEHTVVPIPEGMSFEEAATLGVCPLTAAMALWRWLRISPSLIRESSQSPSSQALPRQKNCILVWGGSSATGQAAIQIASALSPGFIHMANTLPESAAIDTQQLIGLIVYLAIFIPMLFIHPSKLQPLLFISFIGIVATFISMFAYCVGANGGKLNLIPPSKIIGKAERSFRMLQVVSAVAGAWTGSSIRQSDWTRFAKTKRAPVLNQLIGAPMTITLTAMFGIFATSATKHVFGGTAIWNLILLLQSILTNHYNPAARAGCFFVGLGFFLSQLSVNLVQNSVSVGMDLASMAPRWIDVTRGALIMIIVGTLINPWRFVNTPGTFIAVLNSFGMFVSPLAGINVADFWIIRRLRWKVPDLFIGDSRSLYWYTAGLNWRAFVSWTVVIWPSMPGFIFAVGGIKSLALGWTRTFQVTWFVGFLGGFVVYSLICLVFPPPGKPYEKELMDHDGSSLDGVDVDYEKGGSEFDANPKELAGVKTTTDTGV